MADHPSVADVAGALQVHAPLPDGAVPLEAVMLVKYLDGDRVQWASRLTTGLTTVDAIGALETFAALQKHHATGCCTNCR